MSCRNPPSSHRVIRYPLGLGLLAASACSTAQMGSPELVSHNGFEACWSKAITKPQFLSLLKSTIDGTLGCILYASYADAGFNWEICNTPACPNMSGGCPVTLRAGTFSGDFAPGAYTAGFSGPGTTDDISIPVTYYNDVTGGSCTLKLTNLTQTYSPFVYVLPDGNNGDNIWGMDFLTVTFDTHVASSADSNCLTQEQTLISYAQSAASIQSAIPLFDAVADESVCPLTP
jgi:hypothetical protein